MTDEQIETLLDEHLSPFELWVEMTAGCAAWKPFWGQIQLFWEEYFETAGVACFDPSAPSFPNIAFLEACAARWRERKLIPYAPSAPRRRSQR